MAACDRLACRESSVEPAREPGVCPENLDGLYASPSTRLDRLARIASQEMYRILSAVDGREPCRVDRPDRTESRETRMGPAEIVASLKELCAEKGPRLSTEEIVAWIDRIGGFETDAELIAVRQEDEGPAVRPDARVRGRGVGPEDQAALELLRRPTRGRRFYVDILEMPDEQRTRLIRQYARFVKQLRSVRKAMADYFAGQRFFDFYPGDDPDPEEVEVEEEAVPNGKRG